VGKPEARLIGEKNPPYSLFLPRLLTLFPEARILHMVRDPRDTILSFQSVDFDLRSTSGLAYRWLQYNREAADASEAFPGRILTERFEDLLQEPEVVLGRICSFLELRLPQELLTVKEGGRNVFSWNSKILKPLEPGRAYAWKRNMSPDSVRASDTVCHPWQKRWGYETNYPNRPFASRLQALPGVIVGHISIALEKGLVKLPISMQMRIMQTYRRYDRETPQVRPDREAGRKRESRQP